MKIKIVAIIVAIFIFAGIVYSLPAPTTRITSGQSEIAEIEEPCLIEKPGYNDTSQQPLDDDEPSLKVILKVRGLFPRLGLRWYLIGVSVKNLDNREVTLGVGRPAGGFVIYNESGKEIYRKPEYTIKVLNSLSLRPHQRKTLYLGIWNMRWQIAEKYVVYGVMYGYEYKGETYLSIESDPVTIYPPVEAR